MMLARVRQLVMTLVLACSAGVSLSSAGELRKWTSADGKFSVTGEMIGFADDVVVIQKEKQGGTIRVPLSKLSQADRDFADAFKRKAFGLPGPADATAVAGSDDIWTLNAQVKIRLPANTKTFTVSSKDPARFRAERTDKPAEYLLVECLPFMESRQARINHLNQAIDDCVKELTKVGATIKREPARFLTSPPRRYVTVIEAKLKDGQEIECHLVVRFDLEGCITLRALGDHDFADSAITPAKTLTYVNPATLAEVKVQQTPDKSQPGKTTGIPADKKKSLSEFIAMTQTLLKKGDMKAFIQTTVDPDDLKMILQSTTLDEVSQLFDREKQAQLRGALESLDWKSAEYLAEQRRIVFKREPPDQPMIFVETDSGWRMKN